MRQADKEISSKIIKLLKSGELFAAEAELGLHHGPYFGYFHGHENMSRIVDNLPDGAVQKSEVFLLATCFSLVKSGQSLRARSLLDRVRPQFRQTYISRLADLAVAIFLAEDITDRKLRDWEQLELEIPVSSSLEYGIYFNSMVIILMRLDRLEQARLMALKAIQAYRSIGHAGLEFYVSVHLATICTREGRLSEARRHLRLARQQLFREINHEKPYAYLADIVEITIDWERGASTGITDRIVEVLPKLSTNDSLQDVLLELARVGTMVTYYSAGSEAALEFIDTMQSHFHREHGRLSRAISALSSFVSAMEGHEELAELAMRRIDEAKVRSTSGRLILLSANGRMFPKETLAGMAAVSTRDIRKIVLRSLIGAAVAKQNRDVTQWRRLTLTALRAAEGEGLLGPFLENRDTLVGLKTWLLNAKFARGNKRLAWFSRLVANRVDETFALPDYISRQGLTVKQMRVLTEVRKGSSNKVIARKLGVSEAAIKYHVSKMLNSFGVKSRGELANLAEVQSSLPQTNPLTAHREVIP